MNRHRVSAVPIVNAEGVMVGTLSLSDLKSMTNDSFMALHQQTGEFAGKHSYYGNPNMPVVRILLKEI